MELSIKEKIEILARRQGVSMSELARRIGKTPANFLQILKRDNFRVSELEEIAAALGLDLVIEFREKPTGGTP